MIVGRRPRKRKIENCTIEGCDRIHYAKGMCKYHYQLRDKGPCKLPEFSKPARNCGYCDMHYARLRSTGDPRGLKKVGRPTKMW